MLPEQLSLITTLGTPAIHPDGSWALVAVTRPDFDADEYTGQLWRIDLTGTDEPRRFTRGFRDSRPLFAGDTVVFLRAEQGGKPQLWALPTGGGEAVQLTDCTLGVTDFDVSPDGTHVVYTARVPEEGRYGTVDGVSAGAEDPRHISTLKFQFNGVGYVTDKRSHVFVIEVPDLNAEPAITPVGRAKQALGEQDAPSPFPVPRQLTDGDVDDTYPRFTPDGNAVLFVASRHDEADSDLRTQLYQVPLTGGEPTAISGQVTATAPVVSGSDIFFLGYDLGESGRDFVGKNTAVYLAQPDAEPRRLTDASYDIIETLALRPEGGVYAIEEYRGTQRLLSVSPDGEIEVMVNDDVVVTSAVAVPDSDEVVAAVMTPTSTGELWRARAGSTPQVLTDFSASLREQTQVATPRELTATASDGYDIHGWALLPEGDGPHPVLLVIHGGPFAAYHSAWFDEAQVYVEAGYAVVMCNPRGSAGYGEQHGQAIKGAFGQRDYLDIMEFFDHALAELPQLDGERAGVMGGSYGGYMTAWIVGNTDRFRGAIVERGFLDPRSFVGSADIGWFFTHEYNTADPEVMDAQSPMHLTEKVTTPVFVVHSEQDLRCPLSQALRYYTQLKLAGVDTELLVFPGENHELSRSGTPWHRRQRFEAILAWWAKHLPLATDAEVSA